MKTFEGFITEIKDKSHPDGTYISAKLSDDSSNALDKWVTNNNIQNATDPKEYHSTVVYSRKGIPDAKSYDLGLPIQGKITKWELFPTQSGTKALVGIVDSPELTKHHVTLKKDFGATHDYPEYHPHVTISYDHAGPKPSEVPDFNITFDKSEFKALDPTFVPPTKDKNNDNDD